ncbi:hypothetical protein OROGR_027645 [Orobanche gracilis]
MNYRAWNHRCWLVSYMSNSQMCCLSCIVLKIGQGFTLLITLASIIELDWFEGELQLDERNGADDNFSGGYDKKRLLLQLMESTRQNKDPDGLSGEEFHRMLKEELDWVGTLIRRYVGREALWLHRRFLSLTWVKQQLAVDDDQSSIASCHSCCTSCDINIFIKEELMLIYSCVNFPYDVDDDFGDYRAQATYAATYIAWLAKKMPISFGVELRRNSEYEGCLKLLFDGAGKSCLWNSMAASCGII